MSNESRETLKRKDEITDYVIRALREYDIHINQEIEIDKLLLDKIVDFYFKYLKPTAQTMRSSEFKYATKVLFAYEIQNGL